MKKKNFLVLFILLLPFCALAQKSYTIKGQITDFDTGKILNNVDLVVENATTGTISDQKGNYLLHLPVGEYEITYSMKGYQQKTITVVLNSNTEINIKLEKRKDGHKNAKNDPGVLSFLIRRAEK